MDNMQKLSTIIITGCNRGLGYHLLRTVVVKNPHIHVIGTVRSHKQQLKQQFDQEFPANNVSIMQLDIGKPHSIRQFGSNLQLIDRQIDALVNNAAVMHDKISEIRILSEKQAADTFQTNLFGTIELTNQIRPYLNQNARIVNVSSKLGALKFQGPNIHEIFNNHHLTMQNIHQAVIQYIDGCAKGDLGQFYTSAYGTSKMMLNAWSRFILQKQLLNNQVAICMSPGHCKTDMGGSNALRSAQEGALSIYILLWHECDSNRFYHCTGESDYENCG